VVFGGFSAQSIADRLEDAGAEYIITADGAYRGEKVIPLKNVIDDALIGNRTVKKVIVYTRTRTAVSMIKGRDVWWEDEMDHAEGQVEKGVPCRFRPKKWMQKTRCLFCTHRVARQAKRRGALLRRLYGVDGYTFVNVFSTSP
jgi:acetyl-CoA synthetase